MLLLMYRTKEDCGPLAQSHRHMIRSMDVHVQSQCSDCHQCQTQWPACLSVTSGGIKPFSFRNEERKLFILFLANVYIAHRIVVSLSDWQRKKTDLVIVRVLCYDRIKLWSWIADQETWSRFSCSLSSHSARVKSLLSITIVRIPFIELVSDLVFISWDWVDATRPNHAGTITYFYFSGNYWQTPTWTSFSDSVFSVHNKCIASKTMEFHDLVLDHVQTNSKCMKFVGSWEPRQDSSILGPTSRS